MGYGWTVFYVVFAIVNGVNAFWYYDRGRWGWTVACAAATLLCFAGIFTTAADRERAERAAEEKEEET